MKNISTNSDVSGDVAKLLDKHDYRVVMHKTDSGCITFFPRPLIFPPISFVRMYQEYVDLGVNICGYNEQGEQVNQYIQQCPGYAQRLFTIYNTAHKCMLINYDVSLIKLILDDTVVTEDIFFPQHVSPFMSDKDAEKEYVLRELISQCLRISGFSLEDDEFAKQESIWDGYVAIKQLFIPEDYDEDEKDIKENQHLLQSEQNNIYAQ